MYEDGTPKSFKIKGKEEEEYLKVEKEVIRVMNSLDDKKWISGICNGENVATEITIPIRLKLK